MAATLGSVPLPVVTGLGAAAVGAVTSTPLVAGVGAVCAGMAGRTWERRRRAAREQEARAALAEALGALAAELRSGRPLEAAARTAVGVGGEGGSGSALVAAVCAPPATVFVAKGSLDRELARISAAVTLSRRTGCSLAAVLAAVEDDLRSGIRQAADLRSATAGPRASAALLAGLPLLGVVMGSGVGADPWHVLTATGTGNVLLLAGVGLELAGIAWSARLVRRALW
jgi:tight adherence protein B